MLTKQQLELINYKNSADVINMALSMRNFWDSQVCLDAIQSTYFKQVEFIDPHQVVFTHYFSDEETKFHNDGLIPEDYNLSPMFYRYNLD